MLAKRIIPCLDVKEGKVVKGTQFNNHVIVGDMIELATYYNREGADELVFYDITASCDGRTLDRSWVTNVAQCLNVPFCVAGGIKTLSDAEALLNAGADKISINSPALENPNFIDELVLEFGTQCVVIGIDSFRRDDQFHVYQYTGHHKKTKATGRLTVEWALEVEARGAGEIVLNCMNQDGMHQGYDIAQLIKIRERSRLPLIASGGAGCLHDFLNVFKMANVDGALAASVFHSRLVPVPALKNFLSQNNIKVRQ